MPAYLAEWQHSTVNSRNAKQKEGDAGAKNSLGPFELCLLESLAGRSYPCEPRSISIATFF